MERLKDKIVLITGAAGSVGQAVAEAVDAAGGIAVTSDLAGRHGADHALDVTSEADWLRVIAEIGSAHDRLDGLVNAAGLAALGNIEETDFATWRQILCGQSRRHVSRLQARRLRCSSAAAARSSMSPRSRA